MTHHRDRACVRLHYALSLCRECGRPIEAQAHAPATFGGLFCARCCPVCHAEVLDTGVVAISSRDGRGDSQLGQKVKKRR
jgi:hypothetical protein